MNNSNGGRIKKLFGNVALFGIGNFVSKILVMLLVPFYTHVLSTEEYGIADGMQSTLLLLVPLLTLNIGEAALRFGIEKGKEKETQGRGDIFHIMLKYVIMADVLVAAVCSLLRIAIGGETGTYAVFFAGLFISNSIYEAMILYCQGCEMVQVMVAGSIICSILVISSNLITLLVIKMGLYGYLISQMVSFLGAAVIMMLCMKFFGYIKKSCKNRELEIQMRGYGSSMLLYSTSSWVNNVLDRYFILALCGAAANGIYAVAYKIPAILMVFQRIFAQAWQISANKSYDDEDSAEFFSGIYKGYQTVMCIGCSALIMLVKIVAYFLFQKDFYEAWVLVPPLLMSVIFGALTGFLGSICLAFKDGKSMGEATGMGALVNIVCNFIGIKLMGPMGAALSTLLSYYIMYEMAYRRVGKYVAFNVNRKKDFLSYGILLLQFIFVSLALPGWIIVEITGFALICIMYLRQMYEIVKKRIK